MTGYVLLLLFRLYYDFLHMKFERVTYKLNICLFVFLNLINKEINEMKILIKSNK
jgi:hypothetical protein